MRYFKYDDEYSQIGGGITYVEAEDGWTIRQVTLNGEQYLASNINDPTWGLSLADGQIDYDNLDDQVTEITSDEFEDIWRSILARHETTWRHSQTRYPIGSSVQGVLVIFYPQGVIIKLDPETLGVADHEQCRASTAWGNMYPKHKVTATVKGYNEEQHWIVLDNPHVYSEQIE